MPMTSTRVPRELSLTSGEPPPDGKSFVDFLARPLTRSATGSKARRGSTTCDIPQENGMVKSFSSLRTLRFPEENFPP